MRRDSPGRRVRACCVAVVGLACVLGCPQGDGDDEGPLACVDVDPDGCAPLYAPSWSNVYSMTLTTDCATGGLSCHASADALGAEQHGLFFADMDAARSLLLEDRGDETFVDPDAVGCSQLVARLKTDDTVRRMPPGSMLSDTEICSIEQWIAMGAMP
ncbi:MAG TPA: hypothetical protein VFG69_19975 [Nannocystaceae bacterium]|nr:hypothetical protein [Nannocystaceae bacterium]